MKNDFSFKTANRLSVRALHAARAHQPVANSLVTLSANFPSTFEIGTVPRGGVDLVPIRHPESCITHHASIQPSNKTKTMKTSRNVKSPGTASPSPTGVGEGGPVAAAEGPDEGRQGKTK